MHVYLMIIGEMEAAGLSLPNRKKCRGIVSRSVRNSTHLQFFGRFPEIILNQCPFASLLWLGVIKFNLTNLIW